MMLTMQLPPLFLHNDLPPCPVPLVHFHDPLPSLTLDAWIQINRTLNVDIWLCMIYMIYLLYLSLSRRYLKVKLKEVDNVCVGISVLFLTLLGLELNRQFILGRKQRGRLTSPRAAVHP